MCSASRIRIPKVLAQAVADAAMADVAFKVNIIDADGVIIASGDPARLGQVHDGAVRALETGMPVEVAEDDGEQKVGINLPFSVDGDVVGVVGITGPLAEVRPLARLVRTSVSLLVQQNLAFTRQRHEVLATALATEDVAYSTTLVEMARMQGLDLSHPLVAVLVDGQTDDLQSLWPTSFALPGGIFLLNPDDVEEALSRWVRPRREEVFFVSEAHVLARDCIAEVKDVSAARLGLVLPGHVHRASDFIHVIALMNLPRREAHAALDQQPELVNTLRAFIAMNMSMSETAAQLNIHRNTLLYRLDRVRKLTGHDPRQLLQLIALVGYTFQTPSGPTTR